MRPKDDVVSLSLILFLIPRAAAQAADRAAPPDPEYNIGPVFNPTMAIVMIVLVSAFFSLGFFSVYIRRCAGIRHNNGGASDNEGGAWRRSTARGIGDDVIMTFPTFRYSAVKGVRIGKGELECAVCLSEFEDDETLRFIPRCSHVFHAPCIDAWLSNHATCPVCRADLTPKPGENLAPGPVQITEPGCEPVIQSPDVCPVAGLNRPPRTRSTGLRFGGLFPRSHSTGHSLVQPGENCERFTLRLPKDVRSRMVNSSIDLNRTRSLTVLPRAASERRGFRSGSTGRLDRADRWGFGMIRPFNLRTGSLRSAGGGEEERTVQRSLLQSFRDPVDRLFLGPDNFTERSSDRVRVSNEV